MNLDSVPKQYKELPGFGEALMVLGPLDLPDFEEVSVHGLDEDGKFLIFRWNKNSVTMGFDGTMSVSISYREEEGSSRRRRSIDFFIADPIPEIFFRAIAATNSGATYLKLDRLSDS